MQRVDVTLQRTNVPLVFDFKSLLKALSGKEAEAQSKGGRLERALINSSDVDCEAQNPKSKRFYQQLEPTTKQNHTITRSVARSGKLEESENMPTRNHN